MADETCGDFALNPRIIGSVGTRKPGEFGYPGTRAFYMSPVHHPSQHLQKTIQNNKNGVTSGPHFHTADVGLVSYSVYDRVFHIFSLFGGVFFVFNFNLLRPFRF